MKRDKFVLALNILNTFECMNIELKVISNPIYGEKEGNVTCCSILPFTGETRIIINEIEIEAIEEHLLDRGFNPRLIIESVLLHEICHYKQYKKFMRKHLFFKSMRYCKYVKRDAEYIEAVADRYAKRMIFKLLNYNYKEI